MVLSTTESDAVAVALKHVAAVLAGQISGTGVNGQPAPALTDSSRRNVNEVFSLLKSVQDGSIDSKAASAQARTLRQRWLPHWPCADALSTLVALDTTAAATPITASAATAGSVGAPPLTPRSLYDLDSLTNGGNNNNDDDNNDDARPSFRLALGRNFDDDDNEDGDALDSLPPFSTSGLLGGLHLESPSTSFTTLPTVQSQPPSTPIGTKMVIAPPAAASPTPTKNPLVPDPESDEEEDLVLCRVCEQKLPASINLAEHSKYCAKTNELDNIIELHNEKLLSALSILERRSANCKVQEEQFRNAKKTDPTSMVKSAANRADMEIVDRLAVQARLALDLDYPQDVENEAMEICATLEHMDVGNAAPLKSIRAELKKSLELKCEKLVEKHEFMKRNKHMFQTVSTLPCFKDFKVLKTISRGAFGFVYLVQKRTTLDFFAMKMLRKKDLVRKNQVDYIKSEQQNLALLDSPFITKLFYSFQSIDNLYMVMEYCNGGDLYSLLRSVSALPEEWAKFYTAEIVSAVDHIHTLGIVHRDIKPDNLLISSGGHIKLSDFGLSRNGLKELQGDKPRAVSHPHADRVTPAIVDIDAKRAAFHEQHTRKSLFSQVGTSDYLAPEVIEQTGHDMRVDWWAVGVVTFEMLIGVPPFYDTNLEETFVNILSRNIDWPDEIAGQCRDFIDRLLTVKPDDRLGSNGGDEVKAHGWFSDINWSNLERETPVFVPTVSSIEDTGNFEFNEDETPDVSGDAEGDMTEEQKTVLLDPEGFGTFNFKNNSLLHNVNQDTQTASASASASTSATKKTKTKKKKVDTSENRLKLDVPMTCLVAEDNPVTQRIAEALLKQMGIELEQVYDGRQAIESAMAKKFDLIFMDIMMPTCSGHEATAIIRGTKDGLNYKTPIIAFTAIGDSQKDFIDKGFDDLLSKPFTKNDLFRMVSKFQPKQLD